MPPVQIQKSVHVRCATSCGLSLIWTLLCVSRAAETDRKNSSDKKKAKNIIKKFEQVFAQGIHIEITNLAFIKEMYITRHLPSQGFNLKPYVEY